MWVQRQEAGMSERTGPLGLERNVGGIDRYARAVLAVVFLGIGVLGIAGGGSALGLGALLAGAGLGFNALTGFCGVNALLGVDTCSWDDANSG